MTAFFMDCSFLFLDKIFVMKSHFGEETTRRVVLQHMYGVE